MAEHTMDELAEGYWLHYRKLASDQARSRSVRQGRIACLDVLERRDRRSLELLQCLIREVSSDEELDFLATDLGPRLFVSAQSGFVPELWALAVDPRTRLFMQIAATESRLYGVEEKDD